MFLASSVFVKKPSRLVALSFIMVLSLLIYRLAEQRFRQRLQQSEQTIPNQINKPTDKPTMRWVFQCFEGIELLHIRIGSSFQTRILCLQPLYQQILRLLGPTYQQFYFLSLETAEGGFQFMGKITRSISRGKRASRARKGRTGTGLTMTSGRSCLMARTTAKATFSGGDAP